MTNITEGSIVRCSFCRREVAVQFVSEYAGMTAYNLACFHRNTICETCGQICKDVSETIAEVKKHCVTCDPPLDDDDEE